MAPRRVEGRGAMNASRPSNGIQLSARSRFPESLDACRCAPLRRTSKFNQDVSQAANRVSLATRLWVDVRTPSQLKRLQPASESRLAIEYERFLYEQMRGHTHFLTLTLAREFPGDSAASCRKRIESGVQHFLHRLSRKCFKNQHKKQGRSVLSVVVIERGRKFGRTHAHLTLECPQSVVSAVFGVHVTTALRGCRSLGREHVFKPITDLPGMAFYLAKEGPEGFSDRCSQRA